MFSKKESYLPVVYVTFLIMYSKVSSSGIVINTSQGSSTGPFNQSWRSNYIWFGMCTSRVQPFYTFLHASCYFSNIQGLHNFEENVQFLTNIHMWWECRNSLLQSGGLVIGGTCMIRRLYSGTFDTGVMFRDFFTCRSS